MKKAIKTTPSSKVLHAVHVPGDSVAVQSEYCGKTGTLAEVLKHLPPINYNTREAAIRYRGLVWKMRNNLSMSGNHVTFSTRIGEASIEVVGLHGGGWRTQSTKWSVKVQFDHYTESKHVFADWRVAADRGIDQLQKRTIEHYNVVMMLGGK